MLKRIGIGMLLMVVINVILTVFAFIGNYITASMFHCLTAYITSNIQTQKWNIIDGIALALVWYSLMFWLNFTSTVSKINKRNNSWTMALLQRLETLCILFHFYLYESRIFIRS